MILSREALPLGGNSDLKATWNSMGDLLTLLQEKDVVLACFSDAKYDYYRGLVLNLRTAKPGAKDIFKG